MQAHKSETDKTFTLNSWDIQHNEKTEKHIEQRYEYFPPATAEPTRRVVIKMKGRQKSVEGEGSKKESSSRIEDMTSSSKMDD